MKGTTERETNMATLTITRETDEKYDLKYILTDIQNAARDVENLTVGYVGEKDYPTSVTLIGTPETIAKAFRYFYRDEDAVLGAAENIEYRKYRKIITNAAEGIRDEIAAGDIEDDEALTEAIEHAGEVIYYSEAALILRHSRNDDAYDDAGIGVRQHGDDCLWASFALAADIREELGDLDDLLARLSPLSDDEKEQAEQYVKDGLAGELAEQYGPDEMDLLIADTAVYVRDTDAGQEKVIAYLRTLYPNL
jgi:hypothetical protein